MGYFQRYVDNQSFSKVFHCAENSPIAEKRLFPMILRNLRFDGTTVKNGIWMMVGDAMKMLIKAKGSSL